MNVCPIINHIARAKCLNFLAEQKCTTMYYTTVVTLHILEVNLKTRVEFQDTYSVWGTHNFCIAFDSKSYIVFFQILTMVLCLF